MGPYDSRISAALVCLCSVGAALQRIRGNGSNTKNLDTKYVYIYYIGYPYRSLTTTANLSQIEQAKF